MGKSAISKTDLTFTGTGNMWGAIYDEQKDADTLAYSEFFEAEIKVAIGGKDNQVYESAKPKDDYLLFQTPTIKGVMNTNVVVKVGDKNEANDVVTAFPELSTNEHVKAKLLEVNEYSSGFEARLKVEILITDDAEGPDDRARILEFFDTRYIANCSAYKISEIYDFHIGLLVETIAHRTQKSLNIPLTNKTKKIMQTDQETISTKDMFALNSLYDDNPEIIVCHTKFTGLHPKSFHYPLHLEKLESYIFHIVRSFLGEGKTLYSIPAFMTDTTIITSYHKDKKNERSNIQFHEDDPVDITGVLQGYLIA